MLNGTWVCFQCRLATRRSTWRLVTFLRPWLVGDIGSGDVRCRKCRQPCQFLGPTIEIPRKRDAVAWERLRHAITQSRITMTDERFRDDVRRRHDLEQRIRDLESRPKNPGR